MEIQRKQEDQSRWGSDIGLLKTNNWLFDDVMEGHVVFKSIFKKLGFKKEYDDLHHHH